MPDQELVEVLEREDRHRARMVLAAAFAAIYLSLAVVVFLSWSANHRADRASHSACTLVGIVQEQNRLLTTGIGALVAQPGPRRDEAVAALTREVENDRSVAAKAAQAADC